MDQLDQSVLLVHKDQPELVLLALQEQALQEQRAHKVTQDQLVPLAHRALRVLLALRVQVDYKVTLVLRVPLVGLDQRVLLALEPLGLPEQPVCKESLVQSDQLVDLEQPAQVQQVRLALRAQLEIQDQLEQLVPLGPLDLQE